jgi:hypothetical protein
MVTVLRTVVASILLFAIPGPPAAADPIPITGGSFVGHSNASLPFNGEFSLRVGNATVTGEWPNGVIRAAACDTCPPGTVVTPGAVFSYDTIPFVFGDPFATAVVRRPGDTPEGFYLSGTVEFSGASFTLAELLIDPWPDDRSVLVTYVQAFSFAGAVTGFDRLREGPSVPDPVFVKTLVGRGNARIAFAVLPGSQHLHLRTTYEFHPIPEPGTMLLIGTGVAFLARFRRRSAR